MMRLALQRIDKEPDNTFGNDQAKLLFRKDHKYPQNLWSLEITHSEKT